jgi:hypothetical protein
MYHQQQIGFFTPTKGKIILALLFVFGLLYYFFSSICIEWTGSGITCPEITLARQIMNTIVYLPIVLVVAPIDFFYEFLENTVGAASGVILVTMIIIGLFLELLYLYLVSCALIKAKARVKTKTGWPSKSLEEGKPREENRPKEGVLY